MCGLFSSLFSWARRLFANCSKLPQRIATIVWHNKGALRENGTDIPHNLRKVLPAKAHAGTFPCGCGRSSGAPQAHKKLSPVSMRGNSQNGGQTTKLSFSSLLTLLPHRRSRTFCHTFGTFRHKQDSTLVAEQTTIFSVYIFLRVNI